jgi:pimeloyl-ACP methyl ester carboxylesterase
MSFIASLATYKLGVNMKSIYLKISYLLLISFITSTNILPQKFEPEANSIQLDNPNGEPEGTDALFVNGSGDDFDKLLRREQLLSGRATYRVTIDRFYSNLMSFDSKGFLTNYQSLINNNLIPKTATLYLRVYDVDEKGSGDFRPEVDHVYVNGNLVKYKSGDPFKLTSGDKNWSINHIEIPIEYLKFPRIWGINGNSPEAENIIEIDIDIYAQRWQVQCDWISIEIESPIRPILLIHGFAASPATWDIFSRWLTIDGIPFYVPDASVLDPNGAIIKNANKIAIEMPKVLKKFGVDRVNIVAHSKGGLDSRAYLRMHGKNYVEALVQLATPNHGSEVAELGLPLAKKIKVKLPASEQLSLSWLRDNFNFSQNKKAPNTYRPIFTEAKYSNDIFILTGAKHTWFSYGGLYLPHDKIVSAISTTLPWNYVSLTTPIALTTKDIYPNSLPRRVNDGEYLYDHSEMHDQLTVYNRVKGILSSYTLGKNQTEFKREKLPPTYTQNTKNDTLINRIIYNSANSLIANTKKIINITVDETTEVRLRALSLEGDYSFSLINPSNVVIDSNSENYHSNNGVFGKISEYTISNPQAGNWQLIVDAATSDVTVLNEVSLISNKYINVVTEKNIYTVDESFLITTEFLEGTIPIKGATVSVELLKHDGSLDSLILFDDGTNGDTISNDGIYSNTYNGTNINGVLDIKATGKIGNISRVSIKHVTIIPNSAKLDGTYNEIEIDSDGDGLIDSLKIKVGVNVITPGHFSLLASLKHSSDSIITTATFTSISGTELSSGTQNIELTFIGKEIFKQGFDGPYLLSDVSLSDISSNLEVDFAEQPFVTQSYTKNKFERPAIFLTGDYSETTTSTNGKIDWITITFDTDVIKPGRYKYNAQLTDTNDNIITWAKWETYVLESDIGVNTFYLYFEGKEINKKRFNGPYVVKNLSIYSEDFSLLDVNVFERNLLTTANYKFSDFRGKLIVANVINSVTSSPIRNAEIAYYGTENYNSTKVFAYGTTDKDGKMFFGGLNDGYYNFYAIKDSLNSDTVYASVYLDSAEVIIEMAIENSPPIFNNLPDSLSMLSNETQNISLWDFISDNESTDSSLYFDFKSSPEIFNYLFDKETGVLNISLHDTTFGGSSILTIRADDTYGGIAEASIKVNVTSLTSVEKFDNSIPEKFELYQNYPNPFNPATTIKYGLPFDAKVTLKIFDILGREIVTLINKNKKAGTHRIEFNSRDISSGVYFYTISVHSVDGTFFTKTKKFILMK